MTLEATGLPKPAAVEDFAASLPIPIVCGEAAA